MSTKKIVLFVLAAACIATALPADQADAELLEYLEDVFQRAKRLNRPTVNNEINLLPEKNHGFANTIRCFFDGTKSSPDGNTRVLKFNLSSLSSTDRVMAIQLVLKHDSAPMPYVIKLHEIISEQKVKRVKLLDSGEFHGLWHTFDVLEVEDSKDKVNGNRNYQIALTISSKSGRKVAQGEILKQFKPMLLVYTNNLDWMRLHTKESREDTQPTNKFNQNQPKTERRKRSTSEEATLQQKAEGPCQRHVAPSVDVVPLIFDFFHVLVAPSTLELSFCHGTCNNPTNHLTADMYNNHAKFMALSSPNLGGVSPCCVPDEVEIVSVKTQSTLDDAFDMYSYPMVKSCRCQ